MVGRYSLKPKRSSPTCSRDPGNLERVGEKTTGQPWGNARGQGSASGGLLPALRGPAHRPHLSVSGKGPSQGTVLPLGLEQNSGGQARRCGHIPVPTGRGQWQFAWRTPHFCAAPSLLAAPLPVSLHTRSCLPDPLFCIRFIGCTYKLYFPFCVLCYFWLGVGKGLRKVIAFCHFILSIFFILFKKNLQLTSFSSFLFLGSFRKRGAPFPP